MNPITALLIFAAIHFFYEGAKTIQPLTGKYASFWRAFWSRPLALLYMLVNFAVTAALILTVCGVSWTQSSSFLESLSK